VDAASLLDMLAQVDQRPGAHPIALGLRPVQDVGLEGSLLTGVELLRATRPGPVMQTVRCLDIEALDGIVRGLTLHAGQPSGFGPGHASRVLAMASNRRLARVSLSRAVRWRKPDGE
jgi:hypothetical protein